MRPLCLALLLAACGGSRPAPVAPPPPPPQVVMPAPPPKPVPAMLDEATLKEMSKAFYDAMDSDNIPAFQAMVGPSFVVFDQARSYNAQHVVGRMQMRAERQAAKRSRTWKDERVYLGPNTAVFIGNAVESVPASGDQKAAEWEGWNTVVWTHDGTDWKIGHVQWQVGGLEAERSMWNEAYRKAMGFKQTPNQHLIDSVKGKKPGAALDIAMGQGRNAVFLATKGWKVTGVDISDEGIRVAKEAATKARVKLTTVQADVDSYDYGKDKWDLVTLIYAGNDAAQIEKIKASIKKGGLFVVEYFHRDAGGTVGIGGFSDGELATSFAGWKVLKDEVVEDVADWGLRKLKLVRFTAQKP